jgi:hypothetical protein
VGEAERAAPGASTVSLRQWLGTSYDRCLDRP